MQLAFAQDSRATTSSFALIIDCLIIDQVGFGYLTADKLPGDNP